jgi:hypothetical protein
MTRISEIFESATQTRYPRDGDYASLSPENINDLFKAIAEALSNTVFRYEVDLTSDQDHTLSILIRNHFRD